MIKETNLTGRRVDWKKFDVMDAPCNVTVLQAQTQINSTIYHLVKLVSVCVSCTLNTFLSVPLLLVIHRSPSLFRHTRFLLLTHLLFCDNLQLLLWTVKAVFLMCNQGIPVAQCLILCAATQACSMVDLLLSAALAVDRCVAVKWPLHYDRLVYQRKRGTVAAIWTSSFLLSSGALTISLNTIQVNTSLSRCRPLILSPCLSNTSALLLFCTVVSAVVLPLCYLIILGCFLLLCWDMCGGLLCTKRACVTLSLQATQIILYSVPVIMDSYLVPGYLHCDALDIAATTTYNLGISLIPLVYGYRSRELRQRLLQASHRSQVNNLS
ncbi:olfactory receptor 6B1-like [Myripristis murdjan]|uniref:olfactory receptor 6B1-like n=1 Tax=Myripristis murdjan TaxID=586833 RepID=UPI00117649C2|nr:olfactory receptor 6B1-like [Myripristis murdjan]